MVILILIVVVLASTSVNFFSKQYAEKTKAFNLWLFSGMTMLGALFFFLLQAGFRVRYAPQILPVTILFTIGYASTMAGSVLALSTGPFALTNLIHSYSIFPPVLFYLIFLHEQISITAYIGISLIFISLFFLRDKKSGGSFSWKWLFWLIVSFTGNSLCAIMMKMQQVLFNAEYKNEMMIYSLIILSILFLLLGAKSKTLKSELKDAAIYGIPRGAFNGFSTLLGLLLIEMIPAAISGPLIAGGDIVAAAVLAIAYYKEKLTKMQIFGYLLGTVSIVLLNI